MTSASPDADDSCYAVIFTSLRNGQDRAGYYLMSERMVALATASPGYLGMHAARGPDGLGITVSYWRSLADIRAWREVAEHRTAQQAGREHWYAGYELHVAKVERAYRYGELLEGSPLPPPPAPEAAAKVVPEVAASPDPGATEPSGPLA